MSNKIDQKDINNAAWAACDTFRGVVDPAQYKDYILVMLFLKYISDVWQDHYDTYQKQYGDDDGRILRKMERERFVLPVIILGCAGTVFVVTANVLAVPLPQAFDGVTLILPAAVPTVTVIEFVPCPAVIDQSPGTVHV